VTSKKFLYIHLEYILEIKVLDRHPDVLPMVTTGGSFKFSNI